MRHAKTDGSGVCIGMLFCHNSPIKRFPQTSWELSLPITIHGAGLVLENRMMFIPPDQSVDLMDGRLDRGSSLGEPVQDFIPCACSVPLTVYSSPGRIIELRYDPGANLEKHPTSFRGRPGTVTLLPWSPTDLAFHCYGLR